MAKVSTIAKNNRKMKLAAKQADKRIALKQIMVDPNASDDAKWDAMVKLQKLNQNGSKVRVRSRCAITGRGRGVYSEFQLSRIKFRELALQGMIPGVTKASW